MAKIKWTDQAIEDINNIAEFIAKDSPSYARIQTKRFFERTKILKSQPFAGRIVPELSDSSLRELVMSNYRIIYHTDSKDLVTILTIHNSKKLLSNNPAFKQKE